MLRFCVFALAALLAACSTEPPPPAAPAPPAEIKHGDVAPAAIGWYPGDVSAAFARAKETNKPIFLYWGAEWCPPCHEIKETIFKRPEFIERTRLLVPVYLDGDSESAQKCGERFGVVGYPTMIVFRPDGTEITRLPGGIDLELYDSVLDAALAGLKPIEELIATAARDAASLTPADWRVLSYYWWEADADRIANGKSAAAIVESLIAKCPATVSLDCTRLKLTLAALVAAEQDKPTVQIDRAALESTLEDVLTQPALLKANLNFVLYNADDLVKLATDPGTGERTALVESWEQALDGVAKDELVSRTDRVATGYARVALAKLEVGDGPLPAEVLAAVRERADWGDRVTTDPHERQAVINRAGSILSEAGLDQEANDLLTRELEISKSPYYFMLDIADLAQKAGHYDEALHWLERAYNESEGPATRFQWGTNYLTGVIEMAPKDSARIKRVGLEVLDELAKSKESIYQRTRIRLERLDKTLTDWNKAGNHKSVITALRKKLQEVCAPLAKEEPARKTCNQFLANA